jgi:ATP-dependent Clp protease ATP-binding subunit ClpA
MFERFSNEARLVVVGAQDEARQLGHRYIGTEHVLLALLDPGAGIAFSVLSAAGMTRSQAQADIASLLRNEAQLGEADADALGAIGIDLDAVRAKVEEAFGPGALDPEPPPPRRGLFGRRPAKPSGHIPFTRRSKKVLELSLREALLLRHNYIGTEHILLGILREGEGLAARLIHDAGVSFDDLRRQVLAALAKVA